MCVHVCPFNFGSSNNVIKSRPGKLNEEDELRLNRLRSTAKFTSTNEMLGGSRIKARSLQVSKFSSYVWAHPPLLYRKTRVEAIDSGCFTALKSTSDSPVLSLFLPSVVMKCVYLCEQWGSQDNAVLSFHLYLDSRDPTLNLRHTVRQNKALPHRATMLAHGPLLLSVSASPA